jgi:hypothetical protein
VALKVSYKGAEAANDGIVSSTEKSSAKYSQKIARHGLNMESEKARKPESLTVHKTIQPLKQEEFRLGIVLRLTGVIAACFQCATHKCR